MNKVCLSGRMAVDPEVKQTSQGVSFCSFRIAVRKEYKVREGEPNADFISCTAWRQTAEYIGKYAKKGGLILLNGTLATRSYDKDGTRIYQTYVTVEHCEIIQSSGSPSGGSQQQSMPKSNPGDVPDVEEEDPDDLPF